MKINKFKCFSIIAFIFCTLILINIFIDNNEKEIRSNIIIKYDRNINNQEDGIRIISEGKNNGIESIPIPDINKPITLDAL